MCKTGVRQGDPISPMLFVIAADLLQSITSDMLARGELSLPISTNDPDFPIVQYADDTLLILPAVDSQLLALKDMLIDFQASTRLKVNFQKSCILPINVEASETARLASLFGCQVGTLPFTYLGLPVGTTRPKIQGLVPVVDRMERRLTATSCLLSQGSRLQLVLSTLSSMPIYFLCRPVGIIKQLERIMRQCLWRGNSDNPNQSLLAWPLVCKPKEYGGMGILNLAIQNKALLSKHLSKFYNKANIPWVSLIWSSYYDGVVPHATILCGSFWWKDIMKLNETFRLHSQIQINMGDSALFWHDAWIFLGTAIPLKERFPRLFSFVLDDKLSLNDFISNQDPAALFFLPLSNEAMLEFQDIQIGLLSLNRNNEAPDTWSWIPGKGIFSAKSYYKQMHAHLPPDDPCKWLWASRCTMKIKMFAWLLLNDRLNRRDMLLRRHWRSPDDDNFCPNCPVQILEDRDHLFFKCLFATRVWNYLQITWQASLSTKACILAASRIFGHPFFLEVVFTAAWNIWILRNGRIFRQETPTFRAWKRNFIHDITLLSHRFKTSVRPLLLAWINSLP